MEPDGLLNLVVKLFAAPGIVWDKPATYSCGLQISMKVVGKLLVFAGVADETGIELDGTGCQRAHKDNKILRDAGAAQESLGNFALGSIDRVDADGRRTAMNHGFEPFHGTQVIKSEDRVGEARLGKITATEAGSTEVGPASSRSALRKFAIRRSA